MTDLLTALEQLRENGPRIRSAGICSQLDLFGWYSSEERQQFLACFVTWPQYSGDIDSPVPSPDKSIEAIDAYFDNLYDLWDRNTEYGRLRWGLLDHIIKELSK